MKKSISLLVICILLFSFASCSKLSSPESPEDQRDPGDIITMKNEKKEFQDDTGKTVYVVDFTYPVLEDKGEFAGIADINRYFDYLLEREYSDANANIDNAARNMERFNLTTPKTVTVTFEPVYMNGKYISFYQKKLITLTGDSDKVPEYTGLVFSLLKGTKLDETCIFEDYEAEKDAMLQKIYDYSDTNYVEGVTKLSDNAKAAFEADFSKDNFVVTANGVEFIFNLESLTNGSRTGLYCVPVGDVINEDKI